MKELFDRHAETLTAAEKREMWSAASASKASSRARLVLSFAGVIAIAGAVMIGIALREPVTMQTAEAPSSVVVAPLAGEPDVASAKRNAADRAREDSRHTAAGNDAAPDLVSEEHVRPSDPIFAWAESVVQVMDPRSNAAYRTLPSVRRRPALETKTDLIGTITDANDRPIAFANVQIPALRVGAMSDENGHFRFTGVPEGRTVIRVQALGYDPKDVAVEGRAGETVEVSVRFEAQKYVTMYEEIQVRAEKRIDTKSSETKQSISADKLRQLPVDNLRSAVGSKAGVVGQGGAPHYRGGRSGDVRFQMDGVEATDPLFGHSAQQGSAVTPPVVPTTGGNALPNDEPFDSMFFKGYGVNPFIATDEDSLSTFAVDVDAASYTLVRRYLELGHFPPTSAVRVEEFVNFFSQGYPSFEREDFRVLVDGAPSPFAPGYHLLRIGLKGREIPKRDRKPANLTFVIDVSGSMRREGRIELVKQSLGLLVGELRDDDQIGIVVYGNRGRVVLEPTLLGPSGTTARAVSRRPGAHHEDELDDRPIGRQRILAAIASLLCGGSTNAEEGLRLGYRMARREFRAGAINRIVLCSDGVANIGRTGPQSILEHVRSEADRGIYLTTIGFGMGNYNDVLMEQLANKGDGNYYYVDNLDEARRVLVENATGTLQVIAKDAKVQVAFHSPRVLRYRLLGFENRDVADRDFRNDKVDAGEIGAGHEVTALYEVKLAPGMDNRSIATVRLRYAQPGQEEGNGPDVREISANVGTDNLDRSFAHASPHLRLDAAVAEFAEILKGSFWAKDGRLSDVLSVARKAARNIRTSESVELIGLIEKAALLSRTTKPGER